MGAALRTAGSGPSNKRLLVLEEDPPGHVRQHGFVQWPALSSSGLHPPMKTPTPLAEYVWQSEEFPACTVDVPVTDLATRFGIPLLFWEEPGLGDASGFGCRLASGSTIFLEEFAHARKHLGAKGPTIYVEAAELVERGIRGTVEDIRAGLDLAPENITWSQTESGLQSARQIVQAARARRGRDA